MNSADYLFLYFNMCAMLIVGQGQVSELLLCQCLSCSKAWTLRRSIAFEGRLRHCGATKASLIQKRRQMYPSFPREREDIYCVVNHCVYIDAGPPLKW